MRKLAELSSERTWRSANPPPGLCVIHGIAHVVGFVVPWRIVTSIEQPYRTTVLQGRIDLGDLGIRLYGLGWLTIAVSFAAIAAGVLLRSEATSWFGRWGTTPMISHA